MIWWIVGAYVVGFVMGRDSFRASVKRAAERTAGKR